MLSLVQRENRWRRQADKCSRETLGRRRGYETEWSSFRDTLESHFRGETWIARGDVGGATNSFMVLRQDFQKREAEPPDSTAHVADGTFCRDERNENGPLMERLRRRFVHQTRVFKDVDWSISPLEGSACLRAISFSC